MTVSMSTGSLNSQQIIDHLYDWAKSRNFAAPYGILTGEHTNKSGRKYLSITFGRPRTLDATVEVYNRNFMLVRTSRHGSEVYKNFDSLMEFLQTL